MPATGEPNIIYLIQASNGKDYDEYIWLEDEKRFEIIGSTDIDLKDYEIEKNIVKDASGNIVLWSRKHNDGFIEQGGRIYINDFWVDNNERLLSSVEFPVKFTSNPIKTNVTLSGHVVSAIACMHINPDKDNTQKINIYVRSIVGGFQYGGNYIYWSASGY